MIGETIGNLDYFSNDLNVICSWLVEDIQCQNPLYPLLFCLPSVVPERDTFFSVSLVRKYGCKITVLGTLDVVLVLVTTHSRVSPATKTETSTTFRRTFLTTNFFFFFFFESFVRLWPSFCRVHLNILLVTVYIIGLSQDTVPSIPLLYLIGRRVT